MIPDSGNDPDDNKYYIIRSDTQQIELYNMKKPTTDGIEVYFVKGQEYSPGTLACTMYDRGIYITRSGYTKNMNDTKNEFVSQILAHEILHCMRDKLSSGECVKDIYDEKAGVFLKQNLNIQTIPDDWDIGYYNTVNLLLKNIVDKLLMFGNNNKKTKSYDIPRGKVYGNSLNSMGNMDQGLSNCGGILLLKDRLFQNEK